VTKRLRFSGERWEGVARIPLRIVKRFRDGKIGKDVFLK
jgi:hypothetical protein